MNIGQKERITQDRIVKLLRESLGYHYLGNWHDRESNSNIEKDLLRSFLINKQGCGPDLINRALFELEKTATNQTKSLYDVNKDVYSLLRYGVKVKETIGDAGGTSSRLLNDALGGLAPQRQLLGLENDERFFNATAGIAARAPGRTGAHRSSDRIHSRRQRVRGAGRPR